MRSIRARFAAFVAAAAVAPLLLYGYLSVSSLQRATESSILAGHRALADQVADRFREYFRSHKRVLDSVASQLSGTQLADWQRQRILRNHVIDFPELREIALYDSDGRLQFSTRTAHRPFRVPEITSDRALHVEAPVLDRDGLPTTRVAVPIRSGTEGWLVAELALEELWRTVDEIRIGEAGYAALLDQDGRFIAHGNPDRKALVASGAIAGAEERRLALAAAVTPGAGLQRIPAPGGPTIVVASRVGHPPWLLLIEQPEREALAGARRMTNQLYVAIAIALTATIVAGSWWSRGFIRRILALTNATDSLAAGRMDARVSLSGDDELAQLGRQFNAMAERLVELQEEIRKQERQVMFGRIAAGLVHDISHPIMTIGTNCKLMMRLHDDPEYRRTFARIVDRELASIRRVLEDLRNIASPVSLTRFPVDMNAAVREAVDAMSAAAEDAGVRLRMELAAQPAYVEADLFAVGRVYRNLILNAIQATASGGSVTVTTDLYPDRVLVSVGDTGTGIAPERLPKIFEEFMTTKRQGLGLGLAISRKLVEGLGGRIRVTSEVGHGTMFIVEFPRASAPPVAAAG